jgi:exosortase
LFASGVATELLQSLAIAVYRDGNIIHMAHARLGVAEACSGLRSISSLSVLALVMGYLWSSRFGVRAWLVVLSLPTAIAVNVARIVGTALMAEHDPALADGFYHSFSGWLVFLVGMAILLVLSKALSRLAGDHR